MKNQWIENLEISHVREDYCEFTRKIESVMNNLTDAGDVFVMQSGEQEEVLDLINHVECDLQLQHESIIGLISLRNELSNKIDTLLSELQENKEENVKMQKIIQDLEEKLQHYAENHPKTI
jgi:uncharacterized protein Yka (UPF0111/DUF47 family)